MKDGLVVLHQSVKLWFTEKQSKPGKLPLTEAILQGEKKIQILPQILPDETHAR